MEYLLDRLLRLITFSRLSKFPFEKREGDRERDRKISLVAMKSRDI